MNILSVAIAVGAVLVVIVVFYLITAGRNRRFGTHGVVQRSRLTCPKCHQSFDYEWVPGAALTAVRLGPSRYMACPLCHKWSMFDILDSPPPPTDPSG